MMTYNEIMLSNILKEFLKNFPVVLLCSLGVGSQFVLAYSRILFTLLHLHTQLTYDLKSSINYC